MSPYPVSSPSTSTARDSSPRLPPSPSTPSTRSIRINPASCLSTELWHGRPGEGVNIEIDGLWEKVDRSGKRTNHGAKSVKISLLIDDSERDAPYEIGPFSYVGSPMTFGPYDFAVRIMANVDDVYFEEHRQHQDSPLEARIEPTFRPRHRCCDDGQSEDSQAA
ncbi:MAG: hypothetical protein AAGH89_10895 [Verrucomicrobiota bacterium]